MEGEKENRVLKVKLTDKEVLQKANELLEADAEVDRIDAERKEEMDRYKEMKEDALSKKRAARDAYKDGAEDREVECTWRPNWTAKQWELVRDDTGEIVEEVTMSEEDLQTRTNPDDTPKAPARRPRRRRPPAEEEGGNEEGDGSE